MMIKPLAVLFGGKGFVGGAAARMLVNKGYRVRLVSRRQDNFSAQSEDCETVSADARDSDAVVRIISDADAVINLIGILAPDKTQNFYQAHQQIPEIIATACRENHIKRFVHLSALGADRESPSAYARSKAAGETAILAATSDFVILRPSIIFGPQDGFFCRFAALAKFAPALPLVGGGKTLFQPVYVEDVARAIGAALDGAARSGVIYECGGPRQHNFADLLTFITAITKRKRILMPLPFSVAYGLGWGLEMMQKLSGGHVPSTIMMTRDQVELLRRDNVVSAQAITERRTLNDMGIEPQDIVPIVENYLCR